MPSFAALGKFFGRTASEGAAFAAGVAVAPALSPVVREIVNEANSKYQTHPVSAGEAAAIVAENVALESWGATEASYNGVNEERFLKMLGAALDAPGLANLLTMWRRGLIQDADFEHGLRKAKFETRWDAAAKALKDERLSAQDVAVMVQRGILPNPGWLPVGPPTEAGKVPPMPQATFDPVAEAQAHGFDADRAAALAKIIGLPASPDLAARMTFRGIIDPVDFDRAISEGNTRNEWAPFLFEGFREILTAHDYAELELRGFLTHDERLANTAKHGMSVEDSNLLYDVLGRAPSLHNVLIGLRRGGKYPGSYANVPEPYKSAIQRSNIREEWAEVVYATRVVYPSAFVIRALLKDGALTADEGYNLLIESGWREDIARLVADHYAKQPAATVKKLTAAQIKAIWRTGAFTDAQAEARLELDGHSAADAALLVASWKYVPPTIPPAA